MFIIMKNTYSSKVRIQNKTNKPPISEENIHENDGKVVTLTRNKKQKKQKTGKVTR